MPGPHTPFGGSGIICRILRRGPLCVESAMTDVSQVQGVETFLSSLPEIDAHFTRFNEMIFAAIAHGFLNWWECSAGHIGHVAQESMLFVSHAAAGNVLIDIYIKYQSRLHTRAEGVHDE